MRCCCNSLLSLFAIDVIICEIIGSWPPAVRSSTSFAARGGSAFLGPKLSMEPKVLRKQNMHQVACFFRASMHSTQPINCLQGLKYVARKVVFRSRWAGRFFIPPLLNTSSDSESDIPVASPCRNLRSGDLSVTSRSVTDLLSLKANSRRVST